MPTYQLNHHIRHWRILTSDKDNGIRYASDSDIITDDLPDLGGNSLFFRIDKEVRDINLIRTHRHPPTIKMNKEGRVRKKEQNQQPRLTSLCPKVKYKTSYKSFKVAE